MIKIGLDDQYCIGIIILGLMIQIGLDDPDWFGPIFCWIIKIGLDDQDWFV